MKSKSKAKSSHETLWFIYKCLFCFVYVNGLCLSHGEEEEGDRGRWTEEGGGGGQRLTGRRRCFVVFTFVLALEFACNLSSHFLLLCTFRQCFEWYDSDVCLTIRWIAAFRLHTAFTFKSFFIYLSKCKADAGKQNFRPISTLFLRSQHHFGTFAYFSFFVPPWVRLDSWRLKDWNDSDRLNESSRDSVLIVDLCIDLSCIQISAINFRFSFYDDCGQSRIRLF